MPADNANDNAKDDLDLKALFDAIYAQLTVASSSARDFTERVDAERGTTPTSRDLKVQTLIMILDIASEEVAPDATHAERLALLRQAVDALEVGSSDR